MLCGNRLSVRKKPIGEQVIVVTGASSGVGRAIARAAGERGASVVVAARGEDGLNAAVEEIEHAGSEALAVQATAPGRSRPRSSFAARSSVSAASTHSLPT